MLFRSSIPPANSFRLSDDDWNDFVNFIADKEYDYTTKSEKSLEELKKNSEEEKYIDDLKNDIEGLKQKLAHNKKEDVQKNRQEISGFIEQEIASRYYFQAGKIEASFDNDEEVQKAIEVLGNPTMCSGILDGSWKISNGDMKK